MKKNIILTALNILLLSFLSYNASAQKKHIDLEILPIADTIILDAYSDTSVMISVVNHGPDTLKIDTDTLYIGYTMFPNMGHQTYASINPGDTGLVRFMSINNTDPDQSDAILSGCIYFDYWDTTSTFVDTIQANDTFCLLNILIKGKGNTGDTGNTDTSHTGIYGNQGQTSFLLFPNPVNDYMNIQLHNVAHQDCIIKVVDMVGRIHLTKLYNNLKQGVLISLDIATLPSGVYFVEINSGRDKLVRKLLKL